MTAAGGSALGACLDFLQLVLNPDNNINSPVYGVKGREILAGAKIDPANVVSGIPEYQATLMKYYGR